MALNNRLIAWLANEKRRDRRRQHYTNANLSGMSLSDGALTPSFDADTLAYTATVANGVTEVTVSVATATEYATVLVDGNPPATPVALSVGSNPFDVVVTARDGVTTKTYSIDVTREAP